MRDLGDCGDVARSGVVSGVTGAPFSLRKVLAGRLGV